ncbi:ATP-binding cassette domain-containing protein [Nocardioides sp. Bht2]|uniref:ATP-binding cassette domain-containing protein n=1 Tax=Nocardioides sp. Bht2 TaxID=3392297 RepID=UPI0039B3A2F5
MSHLLEIEHLAVSFRQYDRGLRRRTVTPVESMDLRVDGGELVALVGESGAGKTLLGEAVLGMLPPNAKVAGTVRFRDEELTVARRRRLAGREMVMLPQSVTYLDPTATVGRQVRRAFQLADRPAGGDAVREALAERGLGPEVLAQYPHQLSGGMARRVLLTMALAGRPSLIFADEPTPGLDQDSVRAIFGELREIADSGCAVVAVSHDLDAVIGVADRVVVCQGGRTVETLAPERFGAGTAQHPYSRALWAALPAHGFHAEEQR